MKLTKEEILFNALEEINTPAEEIIEKHWNDIGEWDEDYKETKNN